MAILRVILTLLFQFHKGTIRTHAAGIIFYRALGFQFHKGTIRTVALTYGIHLRLLFQFHKGTIRTKQSLEKSEHDINFNSIKVRLELYVNRCKDGRLKISIP